MPNDCTHPEEKIKFLACSAADRFPGCWVCSLCDTRFNFDPARRTSVHYLDKPNPGSHKVVKLSSNTGKG